MKKSILLSATFVLVSVMPSFASAKIVLKDPDVVFNAGDYTVQVADKLIIVQDSSQTVAFYMDGKGNDCSKEVQSAYVRNEGFNITGEAAVFPSPSNTDQYIFATVKDCQVLN
jgi:hypothetical protein